MVPSLALGEGACSTPEVDTQANAYFCAGFSDAASHRLRCVRHCRRPRSAKARDRMISALRVQAVLWRIGAARPDFWERQEAADDRDDGVAGRSWLEILGRQASDRPSRRRNGLAFLSLAQSRPWPRRPAGSIAGCRRRCDWVMNYRCPLGRVGDAAPLRARTPRR